MHRKLSVFTGFFLLLLMSCDKNRMYDEYKSLPREWHSDSLLAFSFQAPDTLRPYNLFINLRNNASYRYSNLFLITQLNYPNGKVISDTLEYNMTTPSGEWLGTGFGEIKENKLWYKENFRFAEAGEYTVEIRHAMRQSGEIEGVSALEGVTDVGFRIEYIEIKN